MFGLTERQLDQVAAELGFPAYRKRQLEQWVYKKFVPDFSEMANLPLPARKQLAAKYSVVQSRLARIRETEDALKLLLEFPDGARVESVIIAYRTWSTACISTQVGCAMGCLFCASGQTGFERNLNHSQLVEQLWHAARLALARNLKPVRNLVLMGVGEPLANYDNVIALIATANDPGKFHIGQRRITVSTVGLVPQIDRLAQQGLSVSLAVSLHAPSDSLRHYLMPATAGHKLKDLLAACRRYTDVTGRRITFEYLLLKNVNDSDSHGADLAKLLKGMNCLVNLIPYNPVPGVSLQPSQRVEQFRDRLRGFGVNATVRRSLGGDIAAACGQLRRKGD